MIAAVATKTSSVSLDHFQVGWFDAVLVAVLVFGFFRGRKNGMTKEVLPMFHWLVTVLLCGLFYEAAGQIFFNLAGLNITSAYILGYLSIAFLVYLLFILLEKALMPRLTGSNFFGSAEYYMGTSSGVIRFACILFFALALLHAPHYTPAEIAARKAYNARWFGGGLQGFKGDFFPTVQGTQMTVFNDSFTGQVVTKYLNVMLISTESVKSVKPVAGTPVVRIGN